MQGPDQTAAETMPGRAGLISLLLCTLFPMLGLFAIGVALPVVAQSFEDQPRAALLSQLIGGVAGLAFAVSSPVIGALIDRFGFKRIYIASLIGFALLGALPALLDSLPLIVVSRLFFGVTVAGALTAGMAGLGTLPAEVRAKMFGRNAVMTSLGAVVTFPLVGALASYDWRYSFLLYLLALLLVPLALTLDPAMEPKSVPPQITADLTRASDFRLGVSPALLLTAAFIGLVMYVGPVFAPFYVSEIGVSDPRLAALPMSAMSIGSLIMASNYGRLHGKFGTTPLFFLTMALAGSGLVGAGLAGSLPAFIAAMFAVACGLALFTPNLGTYITSTSQRPARGIGWAMSAIFAVQILFPFIAQAIEAALGPAAVFLLLGGVALAAAGAFAIKGLRYRARLS